MTEKAPCILVRSGYAHAYAPEQSRCTGINNVFFQAALGPSGRSCQFVLAREEGKSILVTSQMLMA